MANSGTVTTPSDSYGSYFFVDWSIASQDTVNNTSTINWSCGVHIASGRIYYSNAVRIGSITIDGRQVFGGATKSNYGEGNHTIASGTITVTHNDFGEKTLTVGYFYGWLYSSTTLESGGSSWSLQTIARGATITSASDFTSEGEPTIQFNNPLGASVDSLEMCLSYGTGIDFPYKEILNKTGTTYTYPLTQSEKEKLITDTVNSRNINIYLKTVIGGRSLYNTASVTFTVNENDDTKPSITISSVSPYPVVLGDSYVQGRTGIQLQATAAAKYGASISGYSLILKQGDQVIYSKASTSPTIIVDTLNVSGNVTIELTATDSRGFTKTVTDAVEYLSYADPSIAAISGESDVVIRRGTISPIAPSPTGTYVVVKAKRIFSTLNGQNAATFSYRSKTSQTADYPAEWTDIPLIGSDELVVALGNGTYLAGTSYNLQLRLIDTLGGTIVMTVTIPTSSATLHLRVGGLGVGIGKYCEHDNALEVAWDTDIDGSLTSDSVNTDVVNADTLNIGETDDIDYIVEQGETDDGWRYRKWNGGTMEQWKEIGVLFPSWSSWGNLYDANGGTVTFGEGFIDHPIVNASNSRSDWSIPFVQGITASGFTIYGVRPNQGAIGTPYYFNIFAIGRWKN